MPFGSIAIIGNKNAADPEDHLFQGVWGAGAPREKLKNTTAY